VASKAQGRYKPPIEPKRGKCDYLDLSPLAKLDRTMLSSTVAENAPPAARKAPGTLNPLANASDPAAVPTIIPKIKNRAPQVARDDPGPAVVDWRAGKVQQPVDWRAAELRPRLVPGLRSTCDGAHSKRVPLGASAGD
jgi:hypothetical protein